MSLKKWRNLVVGLAVLSVFCLVSFRLGQRWSDDSVGVAGNEKAPLDLSLMWKVKANLEKYYLDKDKIKDKDMAYGAISGLVASLGDPYTVFLPPKENKNSNEDLAGEFGGVGISLGYKDRNLAIMSPLAKTPADRSGLKAGDLILKIVDKEKKVDKDTNGMALDEAVDLIRGKVGTEVSLKIYREGEKEPFEVALVRENIVVSSLELEWKGSGQKKIAWVKLYKFSEQVYKEWPEMVKKIKDEESRGALGGIILDLRNNPGGFLQASVLVASDFINSGVVVKQETSDGKVETYQVDSSRRQLLKEKLVVLVNGGSASAAEILAGALKDYNRAKLVGEKTFGKGTVQQPQDYPDGSGLHVTIARWLLPNGKNIHKEGVEPDVLVKDNGATKEDEQLDKALVVISE